MKKETKLYVIGFKLKLKQSYYTLNSIKNNNENLNKTDKNKNN